MLTVDEPPCPTFISMYILCFGSSTVADPECARGGGVSHILAEKGMLASLYFKKMHQNTIFSPKTGGGGAYAGSATVVLLLRC